MALPSPYTLEDIGGEVLPPHEPLERHFDQDQPQMAHGRVVAGQDIVDWTAEFPENPVYDGLAMIVPGYLGVKQSSRSPRHALYENDIACVSYSPARVGEKVWYDGYDDPQAVHAETLLAIAYDLRARRQDIIRQAPYAEQIDFDRKLLVPHSMGGLAAPRYALMEPGAVDAIHGLATVGFGHPTLPELAIDIPKGVAGSIRHELLPALLGGHIEINLRNARDVNRYYSRLRFIFEGLSCLNHRTEGEVARLDELGISYHYLGFGRDILVRPTNDIADHVASLTVMDKYGHLAPQVKADKVAKHIAGLVMIS